MSKEFVDGSRWVPGCSHAEGICVELDLGDLAPSGPEVIEYLQTGDAAKAEFRISELAKVVGRDGEENLVA